MRALAVVLALAGASAPALAERAYVEPPHRPAHDFWLDAIEPHSDEITVLVDKAKSALEQVDRLRGSDLDATAMANRERLFRELVGLLVYARKLSPTHPEILEALGPVADEAGRPKLALDALHALFHLRPTAPTAARLSGIYLRLDQVDDAIFWGRTALASGFGSERGGEVPAQVYLATALALRGDTGAAIDTLEHAAAFDRMPEVAMLALAVMLDRDEQRGAVIEVIERMKGNIGENYGEQMQDNLARFRFAPPEEAHYYRALFAESIEAYTEARVEWLLYAASGGAFRARAMAHVADLDTMRRTRRPPPSPLSITVPQHPVHVQHHPIP